MDDLFDLADYDREWSKRLNEELARQREELTVRSVCGRDGLGGLTPLSILAIRQAVDGMRVEVAMP